MNILVTVGSTPFPSLIAAADQLAQQHPEFSVRCQTADKQTQLTYAEGFAWTANIKADYEWADIIVCHAGAGSVFSLLEQGNKLVVVPNLDRIDHHQLEMAEFVEKNNYAVVCLKPQELIDAVLKAIDAEVSPYHKDPFFLAKSILEFFQ